VRSGTGASLDWDNRLGALSRACLIKVACQVAARKTYDFLPVVVTAVSDPLKHRRRRRRRVPTGQRNGVIREGLSGSLSPLPVVDRAPAPRNAARQHAVSPIPSSLPDLSSSRRPQFVFPDPPMPQILPARPAGALSFWRAHGFPPSHIASS
jgi:hypothetical protein